MPHPTSVNILCRNKAWDKTPKEFSVPKVDREYIQPGDTMETEGLSVFFVERPNFKPLYEKGFHKIVDSIKHVFTYGPHTKCCWVCIAQARQGQKVGAIHPVAVVVFDMLGRPLMAQAITCKGRVVAEEVQERMLPLIQAATVVPF